MIVEQEIPARREGAVYRLERARPQAVFGVAEKAKCGHQLHRRDRQRLLADVLNEELGARTLRPRLGDHRLGHVNREARLGDPVEQLRDAACSTGKIQ